MPLGLHGPAAVAVVVVVPNDVGVGVRRTMERRYLQCDDHGLPGRTHRTEAQFQPQSDVVKGAGLSQVGVQPYTPRPLGVRHIARSIVLQHHFDIGDFELLSHTEWMMDRAGQFYGSWKSIGGLYHGYDRTAPAAARLLNLHERFAPCFGRRECREHSFGYLRGLLLAGGRKSVEPMALLFGGPSEDQANIDQTIVLAWQRFLTVSPWKASDVQQEIQAVFNEEFVPTGREWPIGTVGVIDGSGFVKRGTESVGVQRQWCGRMGKKENCQVGVFLVGATPAGTALLDHQLYLPEPWTKDMARRKKTRVPPEVTFQTKPQIAATLVARSSVRFDWITADEEFGRDGDFLDAMERNGQRYLVEVPCDTTVWLDKPMHQTPDVHVWAGASAGRYDSRQGVARH